MANIRESLKEIMEIEGATGATLVDYQSGMTLGTIGGQGTDMELAGAANTEVVRSKKEMIDRMGIDDGLNEILISLNDEYHLIRVLPENDNVFTYVMLNREQANLGLARLRIQEIDEKLTLE